MRGNIRVTLMSVIIFAIAISGAAGLSRAALTNTNMNLTYPAYGYFLNPCTQEIVAYSGYVHLREGNETGGSKMFNRNMYKNNQGLEATGTTTGASYMIRIGPGRTLINANGNNGQAERIFKVTGMNVMRLGPGLAADWVVHDATILATTNDNGISTVAKFVINDKSCNELKRQQGR